MKISLNNQNKIFLLAVQKIKIIKIKIIIIMIMISYISVRYWLKMKTIFSRQGPD